MSWARQYGGRAYADVDAMLAAEALDLVVVASWPSLHRAHIEAAIDAGVKTILCEKALVPSGQDAIALARKAVTRGATVIEGFMYRYHPAITRVQEIVASGRLGAVDSVRGSCCLVTERRAADGAASWRAKPESGGGVVHDFTCYPVDAANLLMGGAPVRVRASGSVDADGVVDRLYGHIEYDDGRFALVESSRHTAFTQALEVNGRDARLHLPIAYSIRDNAEIIVESMSSLIEVKREIELVPPSASHDGRLIDLPVFKDQLSHALRVARGEEVARVSMAQSIVNACVLDALVESLRRDAVVDVVSPRYSDAFG